MLNPIINKFESSTSTFNTYLNDPTEFGTGRRILIEHQDTGRFGRFSIDVSGGLRVNKKSIKGTSNTSNLEELIKRKYGESSFKLLNQNYSQNHIQTIDSLFLGAEIQYFGDNLYLKSGEPTILTKNITINKQDITIKTESKCLSFISHSDPEKVLRFPFLGNLNTSIKLNDKGCFLDNIHYKTDYLRKALQYPKTDLGILEIYDSLKQAKTIEKSKLNELLEDVRLFIIETDVTALNPYMGFLIQEIECLIQLHADANRISKNLIILDGPLETPIQPFDYLDESVARTKHTRREFIDQKAQVYNLNNLNDHLICYTQKQKTFSQPDSKDRRFILGLLGEQPFSNNINSPNSPKSLLTIQKELGEQIKRSMEGRFLDTDTIHQISEDLRELSDFAIRSRPKHKGIERLWKWAKHVIHNIFTNSNDKGIHLNAKKTSSTVSLTVSRYLEKYGFHKYSEHTTDHNEEKNENELAPNMRR